jgi:hypothetical protein
MSRFSSQVLVAVLFAFVVLAAVPAPAAAHDPGCLVSAHAGPAKAHVECDERIRGDESHCVLSVNVGPVQDDLLCD